MLNKESENPSNPFTPAQRLSEALADQGWRVVFQAEGPKKSLLYFRVNGDRMIIQLCTADGHTRVYAPAGEIDDIDGMLKALRTIR